MKFVLKHHAACECNRKDLGLFEEWDPVDLPIVARHGSLYVDVAAIRNLEERLWVLDNPEIESVQDRVLDVIALLIDLWDDPVGPGSRPEFLGHKWAIVPDV